MTESFYCRRCKREHETLEARYAGDDALLDFYMKKLPKQGWAGRMDCTEKEYVLRVTPWRRERAQAARERFIA